MMFKTDILVEKILKDSMKSYNIILVSTPSSIKSYFFDKCKSRENVIILDKDIKHYYEGPIRT